jgi:hypothetical protein
MLGAGDEAFAQLLAVKDAEQLCRALLACAGLRSSTQHMEAIDLLTRVHATGEMPAWRVALLVCTCQRWRRVTAKLIAALEASRLLDDRELDQLAAWLLDREPAITYPLAWISTQWLEIDLDDGTQRIQAIDPSTPVTYRPRVAPPLVRWAARRVLRSDPARLTKLLNAADQSQPHDRDALIHGLLDAADTLDVIERRGLIDRGLHGGQSHVRLAALDLLCELDGPDAARGRAQVDPNATIREWRPPIELTQPTLL